MDCNSSHSGSFALNWQFRFDIFRVASRKDVNHVKKKKNNGATTYH